MVVFITMLHIVLTTHAKKVNPRYTRVSGNAQPRVYNNNFARQTHSNVQMIPIAVLLNSRIKPLYPGRQYKTIYPKQTVSSAKPRFSKQAQTDHKP